jgi:hypothetical protein
MQYISGPYTQGQLLKDIHEIEIALTERFLHDGVITDAGEKRSWRDRVLDASFGRNTVLYDDQGNPSVMVVFPLQTEADLLAGGRNVPAPAFIVNDDTKPQIHISKYQNIVVGSGLDARALSLKYQDPKVYIDFDASLAACAQKGEGWHLLTNAEWAAVALLCKKQGFMPRGNNSYGKDYSVPSEKGIPSYYYDSSGKKYIGRVLSGSGPLSWSHDGTPFGIYDLNGNVYEWVGGLRLVDGEIQIIPNNNAAGHVDQSAESTLWKAILPDGTLVEPGTAGTLKYDAETTTPSGIRINTEVVNSTGEDTSVDKTFETVAAVEGVTVPTLLQTLALAPIDNQHGADRMYMRNAGERLPNRGGHWYSASSAGVFCLYLGFTRSYSNFYRGFRSAFVI